MNQGQVPANDILSQAEQEISALRNLAHEHLRIESYVHFQGIVRDIQRLCAMKRDDMKYLTPHETAAARLDSYISAINEEFEEGLAAYTLRHETGVTA